MHEDDPVETIFQLLRRNWDASNTLTVEPRVHSGWYDYDAGGQQVTVTNPDESVVGGGTTGYSAITGSGAGAQTWAGGLYVNGWAGTRGECRGIGPDGADLNPKKVAHEFKLEINRIITDHADGVIDGDPVYNSLGTGQARRLADTSGPHTVYRWEVEVLYTYQSR